MAKRWHCMVQLIGLLLAMPVLAAIGGTSMPVHLLIGFGSDKPPYVFEAEERGLEFDIVMGAAKNAGFDVQAYFAPMERLQQMLQEGRLDGIATTNPYSRLHAFFSQPYLDYHNVAVALSARKLVIHDIADLSHYSVSSFQRARQLLGPQFEAMANANPRYREEGDQKVRNLLLYSGRVDVIVGDWRIINYFTRQIASERDIRQPVTVYHLFAATPYQVAFRYRWQRDGFDRGLASLRASGAYAQIVRHYDGPVSDTQP